MIDIYTTAVRRPEILEITLSSFKEKLFKDHPCRLIINVDPVGHDIPSQDVVEVARKYFPNIVSRCPDKPEFSVAHLWCWQQIMSDFTFALEDDWELLEEVSLQDMLDKFKEIKDLMALRLSWKATQDDCKPFIRVIPYNAEVGFFEVPDFRKPTESVCGHPTLWRTSLIRAMLPYIETGKNPEKFIRGNKHTAALLRKYRFGIWAKQNQPATIKELGREWISHSEWRKSGSKAFFLKWERKPEGEK